MENWLSRTELLLGAESLEKLKDSRVAVFGLGGVGGAAAEALARSGIGALDLIDSDTVSASNLNRQIIALHSTLGKYKVDAARERILDINPEAEVRTYRTFFLPENADQFPFSEYDYVVDAIDTVSGKIGLIAAAKKAAVPVISAMGAGNKLDPAAFEVSDISETSVCPLAKVMRRELKKRGITDVKVVYSKEKPRKPVIPNHRENGKEYLAGTGGKPSAGIELKETARETEPGTSVKTVNEKPELISSGNQTAENPENVDSFPIEPEAGMAESRTRRQTPGSISFVPPVEGMILAGEVIRDLAGV